MSTIIYTRSEGPNVCRICRGSFVDAIPEDHAAHRDEHKMLAKGGMPRVVREFLKTFGWAVAHDDGGISRAKENVDAETGKLAVAYSWWIRAHLSGCAVSEFDAFMKAHMTFIDSMVGNDNDAVALAAKAIKSWERFAG